MLTLKVMITVFIPMTRHNYTFRKYLVELTIPKAKYALVFFGKKNNIFFYFSLFDEFLFCKFIILSLEPSVGQTTNLTVQKKAAGNS